MVGLVWFGVFNEREYVLWVKDTCSMANRDSLHIELGGTGFRHDAVLVIVNRHTAGNGPQRIFQLHELDRGRVAKGYIEENWEDLLLKELRVEPEREKYRGNQAPRAQPFFELL
jgi:hypothetical protein